MLTVDEKTPANDFTAPLWRLDLGCDTGTRMVLVDKRDSRENGGTILARFHQAHQSVTLLTGHPDFGLTAFGAGSDDCMACYRGLRTKELPEQEGYGEQTEETRYQD